MNKHVPDLEAESTLRKGIDRIEELTTIKDEAIHVLSNLLSGLSNECFQPGSQKSQAYDAAKSFIFKYGSKKG